MQEAEVQGQAEPRIGETPAENVIALTDRALEKVRSLIHQQKLGPDHGLRVAITQGGCSGMSYAMNFENTRRADDTVVEVSGIKVFIDEASLRVVRGITLDYVEGLHSSGFKFVNPNASRTCGCGSSFSA